MKKIAGLLVVAVVAVGAVVVLRPQWAESMAPGLWAGRHKRVVRERATEFVDYLGKNELDKCVEMTDPEYVRQNGVVAVKLGFGVFHLLAKAATLSQDDVQLSEVRLSDDNQTAEIDISLRIGGQWQYQKPWHWVRVEDQWYHSPQ